MTGVVGIVLHRREAHLSDDEIGDLASAYRSLRGGATRKVLSAGSFARVVEIGEHRRSAADAVPRFATAAAPHSAAVVVPPSGRTTDAVVPDPAEDSSWVIISGTAHDPDAPRHSGEPDYTDLQALDGQFSWVAYDAVREVLSLATDPFGMQALYVTERAGKTYFSTSTLALAKHLRARPSRLGLRVFLRAGYQFGSVTNWEGIERLDPGTCLSFTARGPERRIYWRPSVDEAVARLSLTEAAEHCRSVATETMRAYFRRQTRGWADLTGGYDSRLLVLLLADAGVDFATNTVGPEHDPEVQIAAQLASIAGWEWSRFDVPSDWRETLPKLLPAAVAWGDCHLDAVQLAEVLWGHAEKARIHPSLLGGGGGEHFRSYAWQQEFLRGGRSNVVNLDNWVDMIMLKPVNTEVFAENPTPEVRANLRARMARHAEPYSSHLNTTQLDILYAYKCTGHFGAYASAASGALTYELPFYLKPVFNAAFATDYRHRNGHRLMRRMIEELDPRLAAVTTMKGGPAQRPRPRNLHRFVPYYRMIGRKAVTKISERLISRPLLLPAPASDPLRAAARAALVNHFDNGRPLRAEHMRCAPLFKPHLLNDLLSRAGEPDMKDATLVGRILTVEMALRTVDTHLDA